MIDLQTLLYDPNYLLLGSSATLLLPTGESYDITVIDKTSGIELGDGVMTPTILPAAVVRMQELATIGVAVERLTDANAKLTLNGFSWTVESYRLRPSLYGENDGEAYLILSEKKLGKEAMQPGVYDFAMVRGATSPFTFQLKTYDVNNNEVNLAYDDVRLSIYNGTTLLFRKTLAANELIESAPSDAEISWVPTPAESRQIPLGDVARYEVEVRFASTQEVYLIGTITGMGGLNDD